ncbi:VOC family protein [Bacillus sp. AFS041924]|uniref:VOC family protein n=1 Tax=Bacillus sp. AFS041924 TaxID=2033503 RepID=UPI001C3F1899|nr:VOC family protein [Bacillus sp. AFS041924]
MTSEQVIPFISEQRITPFLTFRGNAEEAMNYYVRTFPNSKIVSLRRITNNDRGVEGKILNGIIEILGQNFMVLDMEQESCPKFTWAVSFYIECNDDAEFDLIFNGLKSEGQVLMGPVEMYDFSKATWVTDCFGVTWQLVLRKRKS